MNLNLNWEKTWSYAVRMYRERFWWSSPDSRVGNIVEQVGDRVARVGDI